MIPLAPCGCFINGVPLALADSNDNDDEFVVADFVDEAITGIPEFDFVAVFIRPGSLADGTRGFVKRSANFFLNWSRVLLSSLLHSFKVSSRNPSSKVIKLDFDNWAIFASVSDGVKLDVFEFVH